jgi:tetratricopeptide (TPR) repeat protein
MESRLAANPDDVGAAVRLVEALLRQTRITNDVRLAARAEQALNRALLNAPDHYEANRMRAELYLSQHRFREAIAAAERTRAQRPSDPINYGILGDARLELGEYDDAFAAFDRMMTLRPSAAAYARVAYARELQGNLSGALETMKLAAQATPPGDLEARAWYHAQLGELNMQLGRPAEAKQEFINASHAFPGHPFAVIGYARAIEAEGDVGGALTLLRDLAVKTPSPDLLVRIGDLLTHRERFEEAEQYYARAETAWRKDVRDPANFAVFLADRGQTDEAVRVAEAEARVRHDIFTDDALAWAYFKAGRLADARHATQRARRTGTRHRVVLAHAEAIARAPSH